MFLAAAPYFYRRFQSNDWAAAHYQSSILSVSTVTNLGSAFVLAKLQKNASYPQRITISLIINIIVFSLLAFSTIVMNNVSVSTYFAFLMLMVFGASLATGINQNGVFAYVSGFGREEYTQAIMAGQGVAGVLPCIVQILSVVAVPEQEMGEGGDDGGDHPPQMPVESSKSAFAYFITATAVSGFALLAFLHLSKRRSHMMMAWKLHHPDDSGEHLTTPQDNYPHDYHHDHDQAVNLDNTKTTPLTTLFKKLHWLALSVSLCFAITMVYPVFTAEISSVHTQTPRPRLFDPTVFIPLAFLLWNLGDLIGRMAVAIPRLSLHNPRLLFVLSVSRIGFIPLYLLCNIRGRGAVVDSDFFYLFIVQLLFGVSNGYIGSCCMMGASGCVEVGEREAAGGFMSLMLVGGLTVGSLGSFFVTEL